jgi:hypothetical protein
MVWSMQTKIYYQQEILAMKGKWEQQAIQTLSFFFFFFFNNLTINKIEGQDNGTEVPN